MEEQSMSVYDKSQAILTCFIATPEQHYFINDCSELLAKEASLNSNLSLAYIVTSSSVILYNRNMIMKDLLDFSVNGFISFIREVCGHIAESFGIEDLKKADFQTKVLYLYEEWRRKYSLPDKDAAFN